MVLDSCLIFICLSTGQTPTREQLGKIDLDHAVHFSQRLLRQAFRPEIAPFKEQWLNLDAKPFEIDLGADKLYISFNRARTFFHRSTGKFYAAYLSGLDRDPERDVGLEVAKASAIEYFQICEPNSVTEVKLIRRSEGDYQFKVRRTIGGIPFSDGFDCTIDSNFGRLSSCIYVPSMPVHSTGKVKSTLQEAIDSGSLMLARFRPGRWIQLHPEASRLEYWVPAFTANKEMTSEQEDIARSGMAIPMFIVEANDLESVDGRETMGTRFFVYIDARNGRPMSVTELPIRERIAANAAEILSPKIGTPIRVLDASAWRIVKGAELTPSAGLRRPNFGSPATLRMGNIVARVLYDSKACLVWSSEPKRPWTAIANAPLIAALKKSKPTKSGFGSR